MSDTAPVPVHLAVALDGLAENPALPLELVRRLLAYRQGFGHVATRADLTADLIAEIIATDYPLPRPSGTSSSVTLADTTAHAMITTRAPRGMTEHLIFRSAAGATIGVHRIQLFEQSVSRGIGLRVELLIDR